MMPLATKADRERAVAALAINIASSVKEGRARIAEALEVSERVIYRWTADGDPIDDDDLDPKSAAGRAMHRARFGPPVTWARIFEAAERLGDGYLRRVVDAVEDARYKRDAL